MGGGGDTKKSMDDVTNDLRAKLLANSKTLLKQDYGVDADPSWQQEDVLKAIATHRFKAKYGYAYDDDTTKVSPPGNTGGIGTLAKLCNITDMSKANIQSYISATIVGDNTLLPSWAATNMKNDLGSLAYSLVQQDTNQQWLYSDYSEIFEAAVSEVDTWKVQGVLVYTNGSLTEDTLNSNLCIIYYVGVFYKYTSDGKIIRDKLQSSAYANAKTTTSFGNNIANDGDLAAALLGYSNSLFATRFQYPYNDTKNPPPGFAGDSSNPTLLHNEYLAYLPDLGAQVDVTQMVQNQVFSSIKIGVQSIQDDATADMVAEFNSLLKNKSQGVWTALYFDKIYGLTDPTNPNPIHAQACLVYYYDHGVTTSQKDVSVTYIYFTGMYYEIHDVNWALGHDMYIDLCNNMLAHVNNGDPSAVKDPIELQNLLNAFASDQFQQKFGFSWNSMPPDHVAGKTIKKFSAVCCPASYPPPDGSIEDWVNKNLFVSGDAGSSAPPSATATTAFPPYANSAIWHDIVDHISTYLGPNTYKAPDLWNFTSLDNFFADPTGVKDSIHQYVIYCYALGDKAEDALGGKRLQLGFCFIFGLYSPTAPGGGGDW